MGGSLELPFGRAQPRGGERDRSDNPEPISAGRPRTILHVDMDAYYASVEQRDFPELKGQPVIVGGRSRRGVVTAASYEARRFGVHSAMPMQKAMRLCPQAIVQPGRMSLYVEISKEIMGVMRSFSPVVEPLSLDEAFVDITGSEEVFGCGEAAAVQIRAAIFDATRRDSRHGPTRLSC